VIDQLCEKGSTFKFSDFLLALAQYVENGTRSLIGQIEDLDIRRLVEIYAEPAGNGSEFRLRPLSSLPEGINKVLALDPYDFEVFVARLLESQGFTNVAVIGRSGDRGVDVLGVDPDGQRTVVQCKRYLSVNVAAAPIQRLDSYARTRGAVRKIVVATSDFTQAARDEANITDTELVNAEELERWVAEYMPGWAAA